VARDHEEPVSVPPHVGVQAGRHLKSLQALGALALAQDDVALGIARKRPVRAANLLVDLPQERTALPDDVDFGPPSSM
jgi:hypothetical protein